MARPATASLRSLLSPASRRSIFSASASASGSASRTRIAPADVDERIFNGLPGFIGKQEFSRLNEWQAGLWVRLQNEVRNNPRLAETKQKWDRSGLDLTHLLTASAQDPALSLAFNYASLLLNNSYFLEGLHGNQPLVIPETYKGLETKALAYAEGITGGGWLWLVRSDSHPTDVDIVPTFASGTLLVTNRSQRGRSDLISTYLEPATASPETESEPESESDSAPAPAPALTRAAPASSSSSSAHPIPLAVLNLYELSYLGDKYGVWGKSDYVKDWWRSLNWEKIERRNAEVRMESRGGGLGEYRY